MYKKYTKNIPSALFQNFVKFEDQSFYTQKDSQMNLYHRFIFKIMLFTFSVKFVFFYILFIKIQVIFINFLVPYFPTKKSGKMYFLKHSQQDNHLSHRLMFRLRQHTMFSPSGWNNNTTSSFLPVNWWKLSPVHVASCRNVNHVVGSYHLPNLFLLI